MRIVLGNGSLINTQRGGGHWSWFLQYALGLKDLGHQILWLELMRSTGRADTDARIVRDFFGLTARYGLERDCAVMIFDGSLDVQYFQSGEALGKTRREIQDAIRDADLLLNFVALFGNRCSRCSGGARCSTSTPGICRFARSHGR